MDNFIEVVGLNDLMEFVPEELKADNFEKLYGNLHNENPSSELITEIEDKINEYFKGMELSDEATIYDYLVLSLRDKDIIATFNWDPFLFQAWNRNQRFTKNLPNLAFLHGNVSIGYDEKNKERGPAGMYGSKNNKDYFKPTRLLYPVEQKNYNSDEFIKTEWERIKYYLSKEYKAVRATIFGYGAPVSDIEAVSLLNNAWGTPEQRAMEQFEIIDIINEQELRDRWNGFIHSHHYDVSNNYFGSSLAFNPRRTSESYFSHNLPRTINQALRNSNPIPQNFKTLDELWKWHEPLIEAEIKKQN